MTVYKLICHAKRSMFSIFSGDRGSEHEESPSEASYTDLRLSPEGARNR